MTFRRFNIPMNSTSTVAPLRPIPPPPPETYVTDNFERANTTAPNLGTAPTGQAWTASGFWRVLDGDAVVDGANTSIAWIDAGASDYRAVTTMLENTGGSAATELLVRYIDQDNYVRVGRKLSGAWTNHITANVAGTHTELIAFTPAPVTADSTWEVTVTGSTVSVSVNGNPPQSATIPAELSGGTAVGFRAAANNGFADLAVYSH